MFKPILGPLNNSLPLARAQVNFFAPARPGKPTLSATMSRSLVHREIQILDHDVDKVWSIVSEFANVIDWAPSVSACTTEGRGIGAVRTVVESGFSFQEKLEVLDPVAHIISYRIVDPTPFPMRGFFGTIHLDGEREGQTRLTWTADAESIDNSGLAVVGPVMDSFIQRSIRGLRAVLDGKPKDYER